MRHLLSLLFGLVIAPVVWVVTGFGQARLADATEAGLTLNRAALALGVLGGAGLVFGLLAVTRISPLGPLVAGLLLVGGQLVYVLRREQLTDLLPQRVFGAEDALTLPAATGVAAVLGAGLLIALFSVGRWRRWPKFEPPEDSFLSDAAVPIGAPTPAAARRPYDELGAPGGPEEPTRAFAGTPAGSEPRYEPFGYVSDEPTRQAAPWPDAPQQPWRPEPGQDADAESERTTRLPGSGGPGGGPWTEPPRR